jgi:acetyl-CoA carboxylase biotin carboxylase subunit
VQRRHQKLIEEAPSPVLEPEQRAAIGERCADAIRHLGYRGVGTVEMLYEGGAFYFIEMNTRLQVEHPVTEAVTGIDLVKEQISVANGRPLALSQSDIRFNGHAIECRINAEDPRSLLPTPGAVQTYHPPGGPGVRVDSALYAGAIVPPFYDSLIAKLVVHDHDRAACLARAKRALAEYVIAGLPTNLPLLQAVLEQEAFATGAYHTGWLTEFLVDWQARD